MCLNIGTHKTVNFPFETNGKLMVSDVPILKHFRVLLVSRVFKYAFVRVCISLVIFGRLFPFQNNPTKNLDLPYKTDLDFCDCFGR